MMMNVTESPWSTTTVNITEGFGNDFICETPRIELSVGQVTMIIGLTVLVVIVISGNLLVVFAVFINRKMRTVTNFYIVSLACADLLVGICVLPFSATLEVTDVWLHGDTWCSIWLAVDVWMCTASILNLCAISYDRYVAITKPIEYPQKMSPKRAGFMIFGVWVSSFTVCFPPLVGWNDRAGWIGSSDQMMCNFSCELIYQKGYVVYSACCSFFVPSACMIFFYFRIYKTAVGSSRAIRRGFRTTNDEHRTTLRIHRGPSVNMNNGHNDFTRSQNVHRPIRSGSERLSSSSQQITSNGGSPLVKTRFKRQRQMSERLPERASSSALLENTIQKTLSDSAANFDEQNESIKSKIRSKMSFRRVKRVSSRKLRMETKAAKTVGIIVGLFIMCWLPFFVIYVIRGFCSDCIDPKLFSVLFWLGYCNSAVNPFVYAMYSKDFRTAFKSIVCRCLCYQKSKDKTKLMAPGKSVSEEQVSPSHKPESK